VENERLLTDEELNHFLTPRTSGINKTIKAVLNIKRNIAKAQDAKSYAIGKEEGRKEAAREIFEEIYSAFGNYTHITKAHVRKIQKHYGVTE